MITQGKDRFARVKTLGVIEGIAGLVTGLALILIFIGPMEGESVLQLALFIQIPAVLMITAGSWLNGFALRCPAPIDQHVAHDLQYETGIKRGAMIGASLWMVTGTLSTVFILRPSESLDAHTVLAGIMVIGGIGSLFAAIIGGFLGGIYHILRKEWCLRKTNLHP